MGRQTSQDILSHYSIYIYYNYKLTIISSSNEERYPVSR